MATILSVSGSPSAKSRTARLLRHLDARLTGRGHTVRALDVRGLNADALLKAEFGHPDLTGAAELFEEADGIVVGTPVYKAAYSGLLKALFDLLPPGVLAGKVVLPLASGGSAAHTLAVDYALRPVLTSMGADHIVPGWYLVDRHITVADDGRVTLDPETAEGFTAAVDGFTAALELRHPAPRVG